MTRGSVGGGACGTRIEGEVGFFQDGAGTRVTGNVFIDPFAGAHSLFESITTETQAAGVIENPQEYPRYVRMSAEATMDKTDLMNSENVCALRTASESYNLRMLRGVYLMDRAPAGADQGARANDDLASAFDPDFSIKPKFVLKLWRFRGVRS